MSKRVLVLLAVALAALLTPAARAQLDLPLLGRSGAELDVRVEWGWNGRVAPSVFNPVRLWLSSEGDPVQGTIRVRAMSYQALVADVRAPFVTTPGRETPVDVAVPLSDTLESLTVTLSDARGRRIETIEFSNDPGADATPPRMLSSAAPHLVRVGASTLGDLPAETAQPFRDDSAADRSLPERLRVAERSNVRPGELPAHWGAYEGVDALVVSGDALRLTDDRALGALRRWVESGGRLVLLLTEPGGAHERWIGEGLVRASPPETIEGGAIVRRLSLTPTARARGWRAVELEGVAAPVAVEGPVGLGVATVLGADPGRLPPLPDATAATKEETDEDAPSSAERRWATALAGALEPLTAQGESEVGFGWAPSVSYEAALDGVAVALDRVEPASLWGFAAFGLALALLVGPVGRLIDKRAGLLSKSWLTAVAWVGLFGAVGWMAPEFMLTDRTQVRRLTLLDAVPSENVAWASSASGIFAASSYTAAVEGSPEAALWRPIWYREAGGTLDRTPALAVSARDGGTMALIPPTLRVWSFQTFVDEAPAETRFDADVRRGAGALRVRLLGLDGREPSDGAVLTDEGWRTFEAVDAASGFVRLAADADAAPPGAWSFERPEVNAWDWRSSMNVALRTKGALLMPKAEPRYRTMRARVASGGWAMVCFRATDESPVRLGGAEDQRRHVTARLLVPIIEQTEDAP